MSIREHASARKFRTKIPGRMDRLPWSRWHWLVVTALGITWVIDGLEVTLIGAVSTRLQEPESLGFSGSQLGLLATVYLIGVVLGALVFGDLTDRLGRKKLFTTTLVLYLASAFLTAISWNFASFAFFRHLRRFVPESPRWLLAHGEQDEAERVLANLDRQIEQDPAVGSFPEVDHWMTIQPRGPIGCTELGSVMLRKYPGRTVLSLALIISQAFLYNGLFFTFPLVLKDFCKVHPDQTGLYLLPFTLSNFLGPLILGRFVDTVGRKPMIMATYAASAVLLGVTGVLFATSLLTPGSQTLLWVLVFFFASSAASSAYLTVSEIFPLELRGMVIALFFALGTLIGGTLAPWLFGSLIDSGSRITLIYGDLFASLLLLCTVGVVAVFGVKAERTSLEEIALPLSAALDEPSLVEA
ncbi:MAG: MFS transporter [Isosphaeraceae bacterium]